MRRVLSSLLTLLALGVAQLACTSITMAAVTNEVSFEKALIGNKTSEKQSAITWLVTNKHSEISQPILDGWLNGTLYYLSDRKSDHYKHFFLVSDLETDNQAVSIWDAQAFAFENAKQFKKVLVNNKLRSLLRAQIAYLDLQSPDSAMRYQAASSLMGTRDEDIIAALSQRSKVELDDQVAAQIELTLALYHAQDSSLDPAKRIEVIQFISDFKHSHVLQSLNAILSTENDQPIIDAADQALMKYEQSQRFYSGVETAFFGLSLGSVLVLAGIGLAITFGVMGVINMAHGELIMIGAYTTYVLQLLLPNHLGVALMLSIPAAFAVSGLVGIVIERSVIRHLYGRPLETLLATFGISLILQQAVRSIFSPLNRSVSTPDFMLGALELNPMLSFTYNRLYIILFCGLVFWGLLMVLKKTPLGLQVRAVSQNRAMARAMGIRSQRVDAMTFGLGSGVAGVAGVALSQLTNVGPNMGQAYIIDSFMVVVFGGVGNLWGTLVAGLGLGLFNKVLEPWAGAVLAKISVLVFIILFIQKRPRGLFPQRGRAAES